MNGGDNGMNNFPLHAYYCIPLSPKWPVSESAGLANITANNPADRMARRPKEDMSKYGGALH